MLQECGGDISLALDRLAGHPEFMGVDDPSVEEEAQRLEAAKRQAAAMRQAASTGADRGRRVLQNVDEAALAAALEVYSSELPQAIARKKDGEARNSARGPRPRLKPPPRSAPRRAALGEDERDRAARRRKLAPAPAPAPARDDTGGLIDAQDREFQQAAADARRRPGASTKQSACYTKCRRPPAGRASNETPVPRGLVTYTISRLSLETATGRDERAPDRRRRAPAPCCG